MRVTFRDIENGCILQQASRSETLYLYDMDQGQLRMRSGIRFAGALLGRVVRWIMGKTAQLDVFKYTELFEKSFFQESRTLLHSTGRVQTAEESYELSGIIAKIASLVRPLGVFDMLYVVNAIRSVPCNLLNEAFSRHAIALFEGLQREEEKQFISIYLQQFSELERFSLINEISPFMKAIESGWKLSLILSCLSTIPEEKRSGKMVENIILMLKGVTNLQQGRAFCEDLYGLSLEKRFFILQKIVPLFSEKNVFERLPEWLSAVGKLEENSLDNLGETVLPILQNFLSEKMLAAAFFFFGTIPKAQWEDLLSYIPELRRVENGQLLLGALLCLSRVHNEIGVLLVRKGIPLLQGLKAPFLASDILYCLSQQPLDSWEKLIDRANPFLCDGSHRENISEIFHSLGAVSEEQWTLLAAKAAPFTAGISDAAEETAILLAFNCLQESVYDLIASEGAPLVADIPDGWLRAYFLQIFSCLNENGQNVGSMQGIISLLRKFSTKHHIGNVLKLFDSFPEGMISLDVVYGLAYLLQDVVEIEQRDFFYSVIDYFPLDQLCSAVSSTGYLLSRVFDIWQRFDLFEILAYVEQEKWGDFLNFAISSSEEMTSFETYQAYSLNDPSGTEQSHNYLQRRLEELQIEPHVASNFARTLLSHSHEFLFYENQTLFGDAARAAALSPIGDDRKDPYKIYEALRVRSQEPPPEGPLFLEKVEGEHAAVCLNTMRLWVKERQPVYFKELPDALKVEELLASMQRRILASPEKKSLMSAVKAVSGEFLNQLHSNFVLDPFIRSLQTRGKPEDVASKSHVCLAAVMYFIHGLNQNVQESGLTLQEEVFCKVMSSILTCKTGKQEGLALAYNQLPEFCHLEKLQRIGDPSLQAAREYLYRFWQKQLLFQFSSETPFMQKLTGFSSIPELAHQSKMAKALMGNWVGLDMHNELLFDISAEIASSRLLEEKREKLIEIFYCYFTPSLLIGKLTEQIDRDKLHLKKPSLVLNGFDRVLPVGDRKKFWALEEDEPTGEVTRLGACKILEGFGLLKPVENPKSSG